MFGLFRWRRADGTGPLGICYFNHRGWWAVHWETLVMLSCVSLRFDSLEMTRSVEYEDIAQTSLMS